MIDLEMFCGEEHPLNQPFSCGQYTYSTDGNICVRVQKINKYKKLKAAGVDQTDSFIDDRDHVYIKIPDFKLPQLQYFYDDEYIPERILVKHELVRFKELGEGYGINIVYLSWLVNLPGVLISFDNRSREEPVAFTFEGGDGLVAPMKALRLPMMIG